MKLLLIACLSLWTSLALSQTNEDLKSIIAMQQSHIQRLERKLNTVISADGKWIGDPTGLIGPQGPAGEQGTAGPIAGGMVRAAWRGGQGDFSCSANVCRADETCMLAVWNGALFGCTQKKNPNVVIPLTCFCAKN